MEKSSAAEHTDSLVGNWKLASSQVIVDGEAHDLFGSNPIGYLVLTPQGRLCAITTAEHRKPGEGDAERAALHRSMLAYTGRYRVEGGDFITVVDASWNEEWNGTEQRRHFRIERDRLFSRSRRQHPASCSQAKLIFGESYGSEKNSCDYVLMTCQALPVDTQRQLCEMYYE